jgi:hypothetical protein
MALWSSQSGAEEVDGPRSDCERFRCGGLGAGIAEKQAAMNSLRLFLVGLMFVTAHGHSSSQIFGQNQSPPKDQLLQPGAGYGHQTGWFDRRFFQAWFIRRRDSALILLPIFCGR